MAQTRRKHPKIICPSQVACDGTFIAATLPACVRCQTALKRRANKQDNVVLRGEKYCERYFKESE